MRGGGRGAYEHYCSLPGQQGAEQGICPSHILGDHGVTSVGQTCAAPARVPPPPCADVALHVDDHIAVWQSGSAVDNRLYSSCHLFLYSSSVIRDSRGKTTVIIKILTN